MDTIVEIIGIMGLGVLMVGGLFIVLYVLSACVIWAHGQWKGNDNA